MLHQVLAQLASFLINLVNNNFSVQKIVKYVARFFDRMDNHILEGTHPNGIHKLTSMNVNPKYLITSVIASIDLDLLRKLKPEDSPPSTPACERVPKRHKLKPAVGQKISPRLVFSNKDSFQTNKMFPLDLSKKYGSFCCFHNKRCSKPNQACEFKHVGRWEKIPPGYPVKIVVHCHARKGRKVWKKRISAPKKNPKKSVQNKSGGGAIRNV